MNEEEQLWLLGLGEPVRPGSRSRPWWPHPPHVGDVAKEPVLGLRPTGLFIR